MVKLDVYEAYIKLQLGIDFGASRVKVTVTKNRKTVSGQYLQLGMRDYDETW